MKSKIKAFVKQNKFIYNVYFHLGSLFLRFLGLFVKVDPNLILFISYGGQKYDDSPRVVYEYLLKHPVSSKHKYVWAFMEPDKFSQVAQKVKVDTLSYYITAMRAGYWITNSSASRGLNFRKKQTKNYLFQHGMAGIKKIGTDVELFDKAFRIGFHETFDAVFIEGKKELDILPRAWQMDPSVFHTTGLPRNDDLASVTGNEIKSIKDRLGIPQSKKVILYAPTFREFSRAKDGRNALGIPIDFSKWEATLGQEYVLLVTAHYEVAKLLDELPKDNFVVNAFQYPELNDLIKVSDILISDYSSIVFDYSIMERPIFCYGYDYDTYSVERGLYTDLEQLFSHGVLRTENEVLKAIQRIDYGKECEYTRCHIKNEYIASYGNATEKAIQIIFKE
ncbi:MAG: CDP-glycerol glycerophosphotransferase family protein [Candidatus Faecousia sp.]|nr:CDP-glycerol glycerophosphotransferase family protein [Candidatus Faecousia sp.]